MKNATKKMKFAILALGLFLGLGAGMTLRADVKWFWLDHPTGRTNHNDPLSPLYVSPTPKMTVVVGTITDSPTMSATPTPTQTSTDLGTVTDSPTASATPTVSPSATISPTFTPTVAAGWPTVYDGDTVPGVGQPLANFYTSGGTDGEVQVTNPGQGAGGSNIYADLTLSTGSGTYAAGAVFTLGYTAGGAAISQTVGTVGTYNSLSISVSVPSAGGCIIPGVNLIVVVGGVTYTSATVDLENYLVGGAKFISPNSGVTNTWSTAVIPVTAFEVSNGSNVPSITITAADLTNVIGVEVQPVNYGNTGVFSGEVYVDDIVFNNAANPTAPTAGSNGFTGLFSDFEDGTADNWGGFWSTNADIFSATDCPGYVAPPGNPNLTSVIYAGVTDTAGAAGSSTPCHDAHFSGWVGSENGPYGSPACTNTSAFPYLNMTANLVNAGTAENLADNSFISTFPVTGATGLKFKLKLGPLSNAGQVYGVEVATTATQGGGSLYFVQIAASSLNTATWTSFTVPFPAVPYTSSTATPGTTDHEDQGSGGTELSWNQTQYATFSAWDLTTVTQVGVEAIVRGMESDLYIDDIEFY